MAFFGTQKDGHKIIQSQLKTTSCSELLPIMISLSISSSFVIAVQLLQSYFPPCQKLTHFASAALFYYSIFPSPLLLAIRKALRGTSDDMNLKFIGKG